MKTLLSCALLCAVGCASSVPSADNQNGSRPETVLRDRVADYYLTLSARDWDSYREYFWPEASLTTVWQPPGESSPRVVMTSIEQFIENTPQGPDSQPIFEEKLLSQEVKILENLGQVWARYEARFGDSTSVQTWRGIDAFTWMKHDGEWRIVDMAYTIDPER